MARATHRFTLLAACALVLAARGVGAVQRDEARMSGASSRGVNGIPALDDLVAGAPGSADMSRIPADFEDHGHAHKVESWVMDDAEDESPRDMSGGNGQEGEDMDDGLSEAAATSNDQPVQPPPECDDAQMTAPAVEEEVKTLPPPEAHTLVSDLHIGITLQNWNRANNGGALIEALRTPIARATSVARSTILFEPVKAYPGGGVLVRVHVALQESSDEASVQHNIGVAVAEIGLGGLPGVSIAGAEVVKSTLLSSGLYACHVTSRKPDIDPQLNPFDIFNLGLSVFEGNDHLGNVEDVDKEDGRCSCVCSGANKRCGIAGSSSYYSDVPDAKSCAQMICYKNAFSACFWDGSPVSKAHAMVDTAVKFTSTVLGPFEEKDVTEHEVVIQNKKPLLRNFPSPSPSPSSSLPRSFVEEKMVIKMLRHLFAAICNEQPRDMLSDISRMAMDVDLDAPPAAICKLGNGLALEPDIISIDGDHGSVSHLSASNPHAENALAGSNGASPLVDDPTLGASSGMNGLLVQMQAGPKEALTITSTSNINAGSVTQEAFKRIVRLVETAVPKRSLCYPGSPSIDVVVRHGLAFNATNACVKKTTNVTGSHSPSSGTSILLSPVRQAVVPTRTTILLGVAEDQPTVFRSVTDALDFLIDETKKLFSLPRREDITSVQPQSFAGSDVADQSGQGKDEDLAEVKDELDEIVDEAPTVNAKIFSKDAPSPSDVSTELSAATSDQMERDEVPDCNDVQDEFANNVVEQDREAGVLLDKVERGMEMGRLPQFGSGVLEFPSRGERNIVMTQPAVQQSGP